MKRRRHRRSRVQQPKNLVYPEIPTLSVMDINHDLEFLYQNRQIPHRIILRSEVPLHWGRAPPFSHRTPGVLPVSEGSWVSALVPVAVKEDIDTTFQGPLGTEPGILAYGFPTIRSHYRQIQRPGPLRVWRKRIQGRQRSLRTQITHQLCRRR
jgi:hypothetical protein